MRFQFSGNSYFTDSSSTAWSTVRSSLALCGLVLLSFGFLAAVPASAQEDDAQELAKKLSNPVASLISVPLQLNYDESYGAADDGERFLLNVQPVIPISLNEKWNLISRTIVPIIDQSDLFPGAGSQSGLGDIVQSIFFSPAEPTESGLIWGVGPVFLLPTGSDDFLTADQWGAGPTAVVLKQSGPRTLGGLFNHIESLGGSEGRADVSATFLQPFYSLTNAKLWTYTANLEATYDWEGEEWSIPANFTATKLTRWGDQLVSVGGGLRYWVESTDGGAEGLGARLILTFLFPK
jgi:hypothetical protein